MGSKSTIVRPMSALGALVTMIPLGLTVGAFALSGLDLRHAMMAGAGTYLLYRWVVVRRVILAEHRRGILAMRAGRFEEGLEAFRASERWFERHPTLDRFRALLLGSASRHPFRILARYNQGYALSRLGRGEEALERLEEVLREHPDMAMASELRDVLLAGSRLHPEVGRAMSDAAPE
ncbi:MAG: tetratricopeptide repeat protein [Sandaracinaceae bacterium]